MNAASLKLPPRIDFLSDALFLDIDGTITEITERPHEVGPVKNRNDLLEKLGRALSHRLAVLTGRTLEETDRILGKTIVSVAAVHGLVRRSPGGLTQSTPAATGLSGAREDLAALMQEFPQLILEEKGASLAMHFRQSPQASEAVHAATSRIARSRDLIVQNGTMVSELRTPGPDKGVSLREIMLEQPFAGSRPIMVGDDLTDEHAFEIAQSLGGFGVLVGDQRPTHALYRLSSVKDVMLWLADGLA